MRRAVLSAALALACAVTPTPLWGQRPAKKQLTVEQKLNETIVSFTFTGQPMHEAFDFLQTLGNVNIVIDPRVVKKPRQTLTLLMQNVTLRAAIEQSMVQLGLDYTIRDGVVFVSDAKTLVALEKERRERAEKRKKEEAAGHKPSVPDRRLQKKLDEIIVSFTFNEQPAKEAFDFLQTLGGINIVIDRRKLKDAGATVTLKLNNTPLRVAVELGAEQLGLRSALRDGVVFLSDAQTIRAEAWKRRRVFLEEKPTAVERKGYEAYRQVMVSFSFNEQPVKGAMDFLSTLAGANIVLDPKNLPEDAEITLKVSNVPFTTALTLATEQLGFDWVIRGDVGDVPLIFISDAATIAQLLKGR